MTLFTSADLCEVRIPTYKRPAWLQDAVLSLINQNHHNWRAVVLDDDPSRSGQDIVNTIGDSRIRYVNNVGKRGAAENLTRAFQKEPYHKGSTYFCVLEDDNWLKPNYLSESIQLIQDKQVNLLHLNQECWWRPKTGNPVPVHTTTLETRLPAGMISPEYLHAGIFCFQGVSNGSLFWSKHLRTDLSAPMRESRDAYVQEMLRCLEIDEPSYCSHRCLSIWSDSSKETKHRVFEDFHLTDKLQCSIKQAAFRELKSKNMLYMIEDVYQYHKKMGNVDPILWKKQMVHALGFHMANTSYRWLLLQYPKQLIGYLFSVSCIKHKLILS